MCIQLPWSLTCVEFRTLMIGGGTCKKQKQKTKLNKKGREGGGGGGEVEGEGAECGGHTFTSSKYHLYFQMTKFDRSSNFLF